MSNRFNQYQYGVGSLLAVLLLSGCAGLSDKSDLYKVTDTQEYSSYRAELDHLTDFRGNEELQQVDKLTLSQAISWALKRNYSIQQSAWEIEKKRSLWKQSGLWSNPELEAEIEDLDRSQYKIGLTFPLDLTAKRSRLTQIEAIELDQIQLAYRRACRAVLAEVKRSYIDIQTIEMNVSVLEQAKKLAKETTQLSQKRFQSGAGSKIDLIYAQIDFERTSLKYSELQAAYEVKKHKLASLWGNEESNFQTVEKAGSLPERLIKEAALIPYIKQMPIVESAGHEKKKQLVLNATAWRESLEDISLTGNYSIDQNEGTRILGAAVGMTLPLFDWKQHQIGAVKIDAWQSTLQEKEITLYARQYTRELYRVLLGFYKEAYLYDKEIIPSLKTAYNEAVLFYKSGRLPMIELIRLKNEWLESKIAYQEKIGDFQQAVVDLEEIFGKSWNELNEVEK